MPYVNLQIPEDQISKLNQLAKKMEMNRSAYIRKALDYYIKKTEREILAEQFKIASEKCRDESLAVCNEFERIDQVPE